jgi:hypothetical protein
MRINGRQPISLIIENLINARDQDHLDQIVCGIINCNPDNLRGGGGKGLSIKNRNKTGTLNKIYKNTQSAKTYNDLNQEVIVKGVIYLFIQAMIQNISIENYKYTHYNMYELINDVYAKFINDTDEISIVDDKADISYYIDSIELQMKLNIDLYKIYVSLEDDELHSIEFPEYIIKELYNYIGQEMNVSSSQSIYKFKHNTRKQFKKRSGIHSKIYKSNKYHPITSLNKSWRNKRNNGIMSSFITPKNRLRCQTIDKLTGLSSKTLSRLTGLSSKTRTKTIHSPLCLVPAQ